MAIWLLAIDRDHCTYEELKYRKLIAQGWSRIGNLTPLLPLKNTEKFKEIIINYVSYVYGGWDDKRNPGRILLNLLLMKKDDFVICCEGETIKGIAKLTEKVEYHYSNPKLYEYAQTIYPVTEWRELDGINHGIKLKSMGPVGIQRYGNNIDIEKLFNSL